MEYQNGSKMINLLRSAQSNKGVSKHLPTIFKILFLLIVVTSCNNSGRVKTPTSIGIEVNNEFHPLLKEGVYEVEYYPSKEITAKHRQLLQKLSKLMKTNSRTQKYFSQFEEGNNPEYNSDIGITKQEYSHVVDLFTYKSPEKFKGRLRISKEGNLFSFKGEGRLFLLDSLTVNLEDKSASFKNYNMSQVKDSINISDENVPTNDTLKTFEFYKGPDGILGLTGLDGVYELLIGKLMPSGKTYISLFSKKPYNIEKPIPEYVTVIIQPNEQHSISKTHLKDDR